LIKLADFQPIAESLLIVMIIGAVGGAFRVLLEQVSSNLSKSTTNDDSLMKLGTVVAVYLNSAIIGMITAAAFWLLNLMLDTVPGQILLALFAGAAGKYLFSKMMLDLIGSEEVRKLADDIAKGLEKPQGK
jgi:fluoride ion exporter CrcB/FEX